VPTTPLVKGAAIKALIQDVRDCLEQGKITRSTAKQKLEPEDFQLLAEEILDTDWYSIHSYRRLSELLNACLGGGDPSYFKMRGAAVAERLIALGIYQQVSFMQRTGVAATLAIAYQNLKLTATLWNSFFNFGTWTTSHDPRTTIIAMTVSDSESMPPLGWDAIEGFIGRLIQEVDPAGVTMRVERRTRGTARFEFRIGPRPDLPSLP
jgi:hypothetical protein